MILSVSQRCDIPAFYADWFYKRIEEKMVYVRSPFNPGHVIRVDLSPENIDLIVFMSKNPTPMLSRLDLLKEYVCCFQISITPYHQELENVPDKRAVINTFIELSKRLGKHHVQLRYDPILLNERYTIEYHLKAFERLCSLLSQYTDTVIFSFVDEYKNTKKNMPLLKLHPISYDDKIQLAKGLSEIARKYQLNLKSCGEDIDLSSFDIQQGSCITKELVEQLCGYKINVPLAKTRGKGCSCIAVMDIGAYNCCTHFCRYCYANYDEDAVLANYHHHDPTSPLLIGHVKDDEKILAKKKNVNQYELF